MTFCLQPGCRRSSMQKNVVLCRRTWLCTRLDAEESELKRIDRLEKRPQARKESIFPLRRAIRHVEKLQRIFLYLTCSRFVLLLLLLMDNVKIPYTNICIKQNNSAIYIITQWQISDFFSWFLFTLKLFIWFKLYNSILDAQLNGHMGVLWNIYCITVNLQRIKKRDNRPEK